ncbi:interleukin-13 receptor subunit alpha-2 isoform X2 [Halichoeres trimaculatus]|uniref:interleukin-13 receptor subunit alpha-2 isoform X2 n=1 Tax=Halichoeres trimaculatus TaxID=147232 RepID=UPI003D9DE672
MASNYWSNHKVTLLVFCITWMESTLCDGFTVDPPDDIVISDPGYLGYLEISWSLPASLINTTECPKLYQVEYFNTYKDSWSVVRTPRRKYRAQFDLMKDVKVRVYTLLSGPCTSGDVVKSTNYTEVVQKPPSTGVLGTEVQNVLCVYHNMKYMECKWERGLKTPAKAQHKLYFWYKDLEQVEECPKYLTSNGYRSGCDFTGISLPDFTNIILCVNGSSAEGSLKPTYTALQIQNHVKPDTTDKLHLRTGPDKQLELIWERPAGLIPVHCLEWEVEHNQEGPNGNTALEKISTKQMSLTLLSIHNERNCFRVRSRLNKYCANAGLWSDWSHQTCYPEMTEVATEPEWDSVTVYVCIAVSIIAVLVLSLCVGAVINMWRSKQRKRPDPLLDGFLARNLTT